MERAYLFPGSNASGARPLIVAAQVSLFAVLARSGNVRLGPAGARPRDLAHDGGQGDGSSAGVDHCTRNQLAVRGHHRRRQNALLEQVWWPVIAELVWRNAL